MTSSVFYKFKKIDEDELFFAARWVSRYCTSYPNNTKKTYYFFFELNKIEQEGLFRF